MQRKTQKMKFNIVEERLCNFPTTKTTFKKVALSCCKVILNADLTEILYPLQVVAKQNKLKITFEERELDGVQYLYANYMYSDMEKALHIIAKSTVLN